MDQSSQKTQPTWQTETAGGHRQITLYGQWTLLALKSAGHTLSRQLDELACAADNTWNIEQVEALDSAGALTLWRAWGGCVPRNLRASRGQKALFEHLRNAELATKKPRRSWFEPLMLLGGAIVTIAQEIAGIFLLLGHFMLDCLYCIRHPYSTPFSSISATVYRAGVQAMLLLAFVGFITGFVLTWQLSGKLAQYGQNTAVVGTVGLALLRELGPFVAGIIIVGRSGASFTAGIAAMRITGEIDALHTLGASPTLRLVFPRVVGLAIAMPLLVIWTDFCGFVGAVIISTIKLGVGYQMWLVLFPATVPFSDFVIGFGKGILFGGMIGLVASYYGLASRADTQSLTANTIRSVVVNLTLVLTIDGLMGVFLSDVGLG